METSTPVKIVAADQKYFDAVLDLDAAAATIENEGAGYGELSHHYTRRRLPNRTLKDKKEALNNLNELYYRAIYAPHKFKSIERAIYNEMKQCYAQEYAMMQFLETDKGIFWRSGLATQNVADKDLGKVFGYSTARKKMEEKPFVPFVLGEEFKRLGKMVPKKFADKVV